MQFATSSISSYPFEHVALGLRVTTARRVKCFSCEGG